MVCSASGPWSILLQMRNYCIWVMLLTVLANAINTPISFGPSRDFLNQRFPCETRGCGCHIDRCWTSCSCSTPQEKLKWSLRERIVPPLDFLERIGLTGVNWSEWARQGLDDSQVAREVEVLFRDPNKPSETPVASCCGCSSTKCSTEDSENSITEQNLPDQSPTKRRPAAFWDTFRCGVPADLVVLLFGQNLNNAESAFELTSEFAHWVFIAPLSICSIDFPPLNPTPQDHSL